MEDIVYANSLYQVNEILKHMEPNLKARIPKKVSSYFENNKSKDFQWEIDYAQSLERQDLLPTTKEILTVLYKDYICNDKERFELEQTLKNNEIAYQKKLREKYNPDDIFKNRQKKIELAKSEKEVVEIVTYKESFLSKIITKIKLMFHR